MRGESSRPKQFSSEKEGSVQDSPARTLLHHERLRQRSVLMPRQFLERIQLRHHVAPSSQELSGNSKRTIRRLHVQPIDQDHCAGRRVRSSAHSQFSTVLQGAVAARRDTTGTPKPHQCRIAGKRAVEGRVTSKQPANSRTRSGNQQQRKSQRQLACCLRDKEQAARQLAE